MNLETVGYRWTNMQSGDIEVNDDEDFRQGSEEHWQKQELVLRADVAKSLADTPMLLARTAELAAKLANAESGLAAASQTIVRMEASNAANHAGDAWAVAAGLTRDNRNLRAQLNYANAVIEQRNAMLQAVYTDQHNCVSVPKLLFAQAFNAIGLPPSPELTRIRQDMSTLLEDMLKAQQIPGANSVVGPDDQRYSLKA